MNKSFILWGAGGHAKVLADIITAKSGLLIALFDRKEVKKNLPNVPLYIGNDGFEKWVATQEDLSKISGLAAIGGAHGQDRLKIHSYFREKGICVPTLVHNTANVSSSVHVGSGTQILALANVAADAYIGESCIVNNHASVDHECVLGNGVHLAPRATLCGCVNVGDNAFIGAGAIILPRVNVGKDVIIGAGAVVNKDVSNGKTVVGNPAREIKYKV